MGGKQANKSVFKVRREEDSREEWQIFIREVRGQGITPRNSRSLAVR
jgi:hypothetical protein